MSRLSAICTLLLALLASAPAFAQFETASVVGTVRDTSGASVPDATVTLTNTTTGVAATRTTTGQARTSSRPSRRAPTSSPPRRPGSRSRSSTTSRCRSARACASTCRWRSARSPRRSRSRASAPLVETDSSQRGQVITGDADPRAAAERPRVLVARAADDRRPPVGAEQEQQRHAARGRVQRQRPAQHLQQLPDRRRRQQRLRHEQPGLLEPGDAAAARRGRRVPGRHQQQERRVRPRRPARRSTSRTAAAPTSFTATAWEFFRDTALNATAYFKPADGPKPPLRPQPVRRRARRADRAEQGVLLRRLRGLPPGHARRRRSRRLPTAAQRAGHPRRRRSAIRGPASSTRPARRFR